jgi:hypothetical protein
MPFQHDDEIDRKVAADLQGKYPGMTVEQVRKERQKAIESIRASMVKDGYVEFAAMTDEQIHRLMMEASR